MDILFDTSEGYIGCKPQSVEEGDMIWAIKGSDVPLAVRKLSHIHAANEDPQYRLLGDTYLKISF